MNQRLYIRDRKIYAAAPGKKLATLIEESDMLNAKSSDSLFRDWQWVSTALSLKIAQDFQCVAIS